MKGPITLGKDTTLLFQGDSITDAGRLGDFPGGLGFGYAAIASFLLSATYPQLGITYVNRGISGNRVRDLRERWDEDCLQIKPDILSIMIGINEVWRAFDSNDPTPTEQFRQDYRQILTRARESCNPILVLCEPFLFPCPEDRKQWREEANEKIAVVGELAAEFDAVLVSFDKACAKATELVRPEYWAEDGVHPTQAGHTLLAKTWLETVVGLQLK